MNVDDLLDPLRYQNLRDYTAANLEAIGGGVFTERDTLEHLRMLDLIAKAYQSVHLPTLGNLIPQSTVCTTVSVGTSDASKDLVTASTNEVIEVVGLSVKIPASYELGSNNYLSIRTASGDDAKIMDLSRMEYISSSGSGVFYGIDVFDPGNDGGTPQHFNPKKLLVNGGDTLVLILQSAPASTMVLQIATRKISQ